jgi:colanic acid biosynthesis glycosyl transferase WcaI
VPSKLYEAMACGKPLVLVAGGEAAKIIQSANCGIVVKPGDIDGLVQAIRYLADQPALRRKMGAAGRMTAVQKFDRSAIIDRFVSYILIENSLHAKLLNKEQKKYESTTIMDILSKS